MENKEAFNYEHCSFKQMRLLMYLLNDEKLPMDLRISIWEDAKNCNHSKRFIWDSIRRLIDYLKTAERKSYEELTPAHEDMIHEHREQ